jgi:hypothetical protein
MEEALIKAPTMHRFAGVDKNSARIHSIVITVANVHDLSAASVLVCGLMGIAKSPELAMNTTEFRVAEQPGKRRALLDPSEGRLQDLIKQQLEFQKTRPRDLAKNCSKINVITAQTNLFLVRRKLLAVG